MSVVTHPIHVFLPLPFLIPDRKSTRLNSSHVRISYAVFCLKKITSHVSWAHRRQGRPEQLRLHRVRLTADCVPRQLLTTMYLRAHRMSALGTGGLTLRRMRL